MAAKKTVLDERTAQLHLVVPPIMTALVYAAALILDSTRTEAWWVVACGGLFAVVIPWAAAGVASPRSTCWFLFWLFASIGAFLTWTTATTPWQRWMPMVLIPGMVLFGAWWHVVRTAAVLAAQTAADREAQKLAKKAAKGDTVALLERCRFKGVEAGGPVEYFPAAATGPHDAVGSRQVLLLPANGSVTFKQLHAATDNIMVAARAKHPIRFTPGDSAAEVVCVRMYRDVLAETIPYPVDRATGRSIKDRMPLGHTETGAEAGVILREISGKIIGERGSGKSGSVNTHLAFLTGCVDALVWMVDLKGGRTSEPWVEALDWVATDNQEAARMFAAAKAVVQARPAISRAMGRPEKVDPSPQQPAIILIVEEASQTTGTGDTTNSALTRLAKDIVVLGRSEAVDMLFITQRPTVTMLGSGDMASQLQYAVGLGLQDLNDARRVFNDTSMGREMLRYSNDDRYLGVQLVKHRGWKSVLPVKGYWLEPEMISGVARSNARFKPELEKAAAAAADSAGGYSQRWDRWNARRRDTVSTEPAEDERETSRPMTTAERLGLPESPIVAKLRDKRRASETPTPASHETPGETGGETSHETVDEQFARLTADLWDSETGTWAETGEAPDDIPTEERDDPLVIPPILATLSRVFVARKAERLHTETILRELQPALSKKQLGVLMAHCGVAPLPNPFEVDGVRARGYAADDVFRAIGRARAGADLNPAAFDWPERPE